MYMYTMCANDNTTIKDCIPFSVSGTVSAGLALEHVLHRTSDLEDSVPQFAIEGCTVHCDTHIQLYFPKA